MGLKLSQVSNIDKVLKDYPHDLDVFKLKDLARNNDLYSYIEYIVSLLESDPEMFLDSLHNLILNVGDDVIYILTKHLSINNYLRDLFKDMLNTLYKYIKDNYGEDIKLFIEKHRDVIILLLKIIYVLMDIFDYNFDLSKAYNDLLNNIGGLSSGKEKEKR